jgi:hypothetical protein
MLSDNFAEKYLRLKYLHRQIRSDLTIQNLAEVILMLSQEATNLKKQIQQLEIRQ